jgi:hypothetical protein
VEYGWRSLSSGSGGRVHGLLYFLRGLRGRRSSRGFRVASDGQPSRPRSPILGGEASPGGTYRGARSWRGGGVEYLHVRRSESMIREERSSAGPRSLVDRGGARTIGVGVLDRGRGP